MNQKQYEAELFGDFSITARDQRLYELATKYHTECEAYDTSVCAGLIDIDAREATISVSNSIVKDAILEGFTVSEIVHALINWHK